jgi:hypothetical protein
MATSIFGKRDPSTVVYGWFGARVCSSGTCQEVLVRESMLVEKQHDLRKESMALLGASTGCRMEEGGQLVLSI